MIVVAHALQLLNLYQFGDRSVLEIFSFLSIVGFFILSGYLIAWTAMSRAQRETGYKFSEFLADRFVRIYICLIPCMLFILGLSFFQKSIFGYGLEQITWNDALATLLMVENHPILNHGLLFLGWNNISWLHLGHFGNDLPLWTLAIEWWMYLVFGWVWLKNRKKNMLLFVVVLLILVSYPAYEIFFNQRMGPGLPLFWLLGVGLVWWLERPLQNNRNIYGMLAIIFAIAFVTSTFFRNWQVSGLAFFGIMLFTLSYLNTSVNQPPKAAGNVIRYIAGYTLTLYLVHFPLFSVLAKFEWKFPPAVNVILFVLIANLITIVLARFTEQRYKVLRSHLYDRLGWTK